MELVSFFEELKRRYHYTEKEMNALRKIVPTMISYYGNYYTNLIMEAILKTKIISCKSDETIGMVESRIRSMDYDSYADILKENKSIKAAKYVSEAQVYYDDLINNYMILGINRFIILAHTYNLDSAKGMAGLTKELCRLVKGYYGEYQLSGNEIVRKTGVKKEIIEVSGIDDIHMSLKSSKNTGLEEGFICYDTEKIVGMILKDKYEDFDYDLIKKFAHVLHDDLGLKNAIFHSELEKSYHLEVELDSVEGMWNSFNTLLDYSAQIENRISRPGLSKDERDGLLKVKEELSFKMFNLIEQYKNINESKKGDVVV